jgi:hypothetical protein
MLAVREAKKKRKKNGTHPGTYQKGKSKTRTGGKKTHTLALVRKYEQLLERPRVHARLLAVALRV